MLDEQHRMHPDIADFASRCMYRGLLRSASGLAAQRRGIVRDAPFPGKVLVLSDLSGMMSVCRKMSSGSRINVLSALVSMGLAICAARRHAVGLITPYHAQAHLLHAMARDLAETPQDLYKISCATVHQFQGSEQDVVIFDAVDCYFSKHPGILLTSDQNDSANRLFNVALSRAKGKFIAVANGDYFLHGGLPKRLMLRQLLDELRANRSSCFSGDELQKETSQGPKASPLLFPGVAAVPAYRWFAPGEGDASFRADLAAAQKEILIDMPVPCGLDDEQGQRLAQALKRAMQRGVGIVLRTPEPDRLPQSLRNFASVEKYVTDPVTIIDRKLSWFGEPTSGANFTSRGVEFPTRFRPQIRFAGRRFAISLLNDLSMGKGKKTTPASLTKGEGIYPDFRSYVKGELTCPECGSPLQLHRNKYTGIFFLGCSRYPRCAYTEKLEPEILEGYFYFHNADGKHCPHDGTTLEAKTGRYGVYARCCAAARHSFSLDNV